VAAPAISPESGADGEQVIGLGQAQQDAALRYAQDAERNLRRLRKALKKGDVSRSAERLAALESDAARLATVLVFAAAEEANGDGAAPLAHRPADE